MVLTSLLRNTYGTYLEVEEFSHFSDCKNELLKFWTRSGLWAEEKIIVDGGFGKNLSHKRMPSTNFVEGSGSKKSFRFFRFR